MGVAESLVVLPRRRRGRMFGTRLQLAVGGHHIRRLPQRHPMIHRQRLLPPMVLLDRQATLPVPPKQAVAMMGMTTRGSMRDLDRPLAEAGGEAVDEGHAVALGLTPIPQRQALLHHRRHHHLTRRKELVVPEVRAPPAQIVVKAQGHPLHRHRPRPRPL